MRSADIELLANCDVLLIDGRSGSGKTHLADRVAAACAAARRPAQVLHVEALYPGWDGLAEGSEALAAALQRGGYRVYDWIAESFGAHERIEGRAPLLIEGCGAITAANLTAARDWARRVTGDASRVRSVWLQVDAEVRKRRALARDGEVYAPHWDRWAAQEDELYARHRPWELADGAFALGEPLSGRGQNAAGTSASSSA
ncbi:hypothetical protein PQI23_02085 [Leucobacter sp. USCH14]|uniref:hypothetical protein n=1 Tax=Leucobacter sp. USCH14 TaxID=3024838 RepID=UPI0030ACBEE4